MIAVDFSKSIRRTDTKEPLHYVGLGKNGNPVFQQDQRIYWRAYGVVQDRNGTKDWDVENVPAGTYFCNVNMNGIGPSLNNSIPEAKARTSSPNDMIEVTYQEGKLIGVRIVSQEEINQAYTKESV